MNRNQNTDSGGIRIKKCISLFLVVILTLTVIVVPAMAETTIKIGELTYLNSDGTARSGMLVEALKAIQSYSGGFQIFGNTYVFNDEETATPVEIDHVEAMEFDNLNSMVMSLNEGVIDGMIVYFTVGSYLCRQNENLTSWLEYSEMEKVYGEEMTNIKNRFILDQILGTDFSFLMMEDHVALRDEFNQAIADMKADGTMIALALSPYRHPDIDIPEGTITTDVYFHDIYVALYMKK